VRGLLRRKAKARSRAKAKQKPKPIAFKKLRFFQLCFSIKCPLRTFSSKHRQVPDRCFYSTPANLPGVRKILLLEPEKSKASNQVIGVE